MSSDDRSIIRRSCIPIATVFIQTMQEDEANNGNLLIDGEQELVLINLQAKIQKAIEGADAN